MKIQLKPFSAALCVAGLMAAPALATASTTTQIDKLSAQVASLQKQVNALKKDARANDEPASDAGVHGSSGAGTVPKKYQLSGRDLRNLISEEREYLPFDLDVPGQAFVSTGPYVGVPIQYAGTDLVINSPSVNTDVQLLNIRKNITKQLAAMGGELFQEPYHSHLLLSGLVEGQASYTNIGGKPSRSDIDVTNISIDAFFLGPSEWLLGFIEMTYDNGSPANSVFSSTSHYTTANSRVLINKAFITIGNFTRSPVYGTLGQVYVPFGTYSSAMISDPLTKLIGRTKARAIELGVQQAGKSAFYGSAYIFRGDSHAASVSKINNGGLNVGYRIGRGPLSADIGAGVIGNIADSGGMQVGTNFQSYEQIVHRVPAYNLRGNFSLGEHINFIAEYVGASTRFNPNDMSFNSHGAKPSAVDVEGTYSFSAWTRPSYVGLGYSKSNQALAMGIPLTRTSFIFGTSIWRNTLQSLELRHDREYAASNVSGGAGNIAAPQETGKADNAITAQFDYYF